MEYSQCISSPIPLKSRVPSLGLRILIMAAIAFSSCTEKTSPTSGRRLVIEYVGGAQEWLAVPPASSQSESFWTRLAPSDVAVREALLDEAQEALKGKQYVLLSNSEYKRFTSSDGPPGGVHLLVRGLSIPGGQATLLRHKTDNVCWLRFGALSKGPVITVSKKPIAITLSTEPTTVYVDLMIAE